MEFKDSKGRVVSFEDIRSLIQEDYDYEVFVGTDSQVHKKIKKVLYATCIVLYKKGKGGKVFVAKERERYADSLRQRLMNEVWRSLEVSFQLTEILPPNVEIVVHIDVNPDKKWKSARHYEELVGMVVGQGYKYRTKPIAWAAQCVADKFSK